MTNTDPAFAVRSRRPVAMHLPAMPAPALSLSLAFALTLTSGVEARADTQAPSTQGASCLTPGAVIAPREARLIDAGAALSPYDQTVLMFPEPMLASAIQANRNMVLARIAPLDDHAADALLLARLA